MALIAPTTIKDPFAAIAANVFDFLWTAGNVGGDTITITGRELVLVWNTEAVTARSFTVTSQVDEKQRTGDITAYNLDAGEFAVLSVGLTNSPGWKNISTGLLTITVSNATVKIAVLKLPNGYPS